MTKNPSHLTLRAKRATFTIWVDKTSLKIQRAKIGGKLQTMKVQMRNFEWFSNNVKTQFFAVENEHSLSVTTLGQKRMFCPKNKLSRKLSKPHTYLIFRARILIHNANNSNLWNIWQKSWFLPKCVKLFMLRNCEFMKYTRLFNKVLFCVGVIYCG